MVRDDHDYGRTSPHAPPELSRFAFLTGSWRGEARLKQDDGVWVNLTALGMNFRSYDATRRRWNLKWLNALDGSWTDLGPEDLGGDISYLMREPVAGHALTRATYTDISPDHFTWRGERSGDAKSWEEFLVVELIH